MSNSPATPGYASTFPRSIANEVWAPTGNATVLGYTNAQWDHTTVPVQDLSLAKHGTSPVTIVFMSAARVSDTGTTDMKARLATEFGVPLWFWSSKVQNASGYFYGNSSSTTGVTTVFRFLIKYVTATGSTSTTHKSYGWHPPRFITTWKPSGEVVLLGFNLPAEAQTSLQSSISESVTDIQSHPFAIHSLILDQIISLHDTSIWQFRDLVRQQEQSRPTLQDPKPDYAGLHDLARHVVHASEVSETALNVIDSILEEITSYDKLHSRGDAVAANIRLHRSLLQSLIRRSHALEERLRNEINLAFHIATEHDSLIQAQIAYAANVDSSAMKTISILGMVFLPGTFISALFSMSFFNFTPASGSNPAIWSMSNKFWVYWVVAIPVTVATIAVWHYWQRKLIPAVPKVSKGSVKTFNAASESPQRTRKDRSIVSKV